MAPARTNFVAGLSGVQAKLNAQFAKIEKGEERGLVAIATLIRGKSQQNTPVRLGNLRNAHFVTAAGFGPVAKPKKFKGKDGGEMSKRHDADVAFAQAGTKAAGGEDEIVIAVGNSAVYALAVHENPRAGTGFVEPEFSVAVLDSESGQYRDRRAEEKHSLVGAWKFMENAVKEVAPQAKDILRRFAKVR